jgi:nitronate monooxygenase
MTEPNTTRERFAHIKSRLAVPVIAAPMFLVSGPELVVATCRAGVIGSFPTLNARPIAELERWCREIPTALESFAAAGSRVVPWAANLIVHRSNARAAEDLDVVLGARPEIVITALGTPREVVDAVHAYGGIVLADVSTVRYAEKAADAGADGLVLVCAGAGGHTGTLSPFAFVPAVRRFFAGPVVVAGAIATGAAIHAVEALGADLAYVGTPFIAAAESRAPEGHKLMLASSTEADLVVSAHFTGVPATYLRPSIANADLDPDALGTRADKRFDHRDDGATTRAWRDIWSAGQGVRSVEGVEPAAAIVARLAHEYREARAR